MFFFYLFFIRTLNELMDYTQACRSFYRNSIMYTKYIWARNNYLWLIQNCVPCRYDAEFVIFLLLFLYMTLVVCESFDIQYYRQTVRNNYMWDLQVLVSCGNRIRDAYRQNQQVNFCTFRFDNINGTRII